MDFKLRLRQLRLQAGLTQNELSALLDVVPGTVSSYENGRTEPSLQDLVRIASVFHVTVDYLLGVQPPRGPIDRDADMITEKLFYLAPKRRRQLMMLMDMYLVLQGSAYFENKGVDPPFRINEDGELVRS